MSTYRYGPNRIISIRDFGGYRSCTFYCPGCKFFHTIAVGRPQDWTFDGNELSPTFSPSILVQGVKDAENDPTSSVCHSFVRCGKIEFLSDCTHDLAGKTVPMESMPERLSGYFRD